MPVAGSEKIIRDAKKSSLSRMKGSIGRLKWRNGRKGLQMVVDSIVDDAFKNFRDEVEVRNWAIAGKIIMWQ